MAEKTCFAVLHNIRSLHNVGAMFRTAEAAGVSKIYLSGYTPSPKDEIGRVKQKFAKTSLGSELTIPWERSTSVTRVIDKLRNSNVQIIALEQSPKSVHYVDFTPRYSVALIVGNEVRGLSKQILEKSDVIIEIPMIGRKESLNVSVAFGIALYGLKR